MSDDKRKKPFHGVNWGKGVINFLEYHKDHPNRKNVAQMRPTEIHLKEDGSMKNEPSFTILMEAPNCPMVFGQITLEMLNDGLKDIGYEIIKIKQ